MTRGGIIVALVFWCAMSRALNAAALHPFTPSPPHPFIFSAVDPQTSIDNGGEALRPWREYPWYDEKTDSLRPIRLPSAPPPQQPQPKSQPSSFSSAHTADTSWLQWTGWIVIAVLLALVMFFLIRSILDRNSLQPTLDDEEGVRTGREIDRVEELPFAGRKPVDDLLSAARRAYERGDYNEAMVYLYSHQLVSLDRGQFIRLAKGKTNRQYLRELKEKPELRGLQETSMVAFEDAFFGKHVLSRDQFERCWQQLPRFQQLLQEVAA